MGSSNKFCIGWGRIAHLWSEVWGKEGSELSGKAVETHPQCLKFLFRCVPFSHLFVPSLFLTLLQILMQTISLRRSLVVLGALVLKVSMPDILESSQITRQHSNFPVRQQAADCQRPLSRGSRILTSRASLHLGCHG